MTRTEMVTSILDLTQQLNKAINQLDSKITEENDAILHEITTMIDQRKDLIDTLQTHIEGEKKSWNEDEKQLISLLEKEDKLLAPRLASLMTSYNSEMQRMQQGKKAFQKYQQPKTSLRTDGAFIDKRQ